LIQLTPWFSTTWPTISSSKRSGDTEYKIHHFTRFTCILSIAIRHEPGAKFPKYFLSTTKTFRVALVMQTKLFQNYTSPRSFSYKAIKNYIFGLVIVSTKDNVQPTFNFDAIFHQVSIILLD
jgi:hypothetical protein